MWNVAEMAGGINVTWQARDIVFHFVRKFEIAIAAQVTR
jgi:hypothetical protein